MNIDFRIGLGRSVIGLLLLCSIFFIPAFASAQIDSLGAGDCGVLGIKCDKGDNVGTLRTYALTVINIFLGLIGVVALIFVLLGGVRYIMSRGDEGEAETGKKTILYAVIGILVVGLAAIVVNFTLGAAGITSGAVPGGSNLPGALFTLVNYFLVLLGVVALIFVLLGGVRYISSQGDETRAEEGKRTILYAVVGLLIVGIAGIVVNFTAAAVGLPTAIPATNDLPGTLLLVVNWFLGLVGVTALIFVLLGGVRYITSQGDETKAAEAKQTILYAVIGIIVIGIAGVLINFVAAAVDLPTGIAASNDLPGAIIFVINVFLVLAALAALIAIIYGGVRYITSRGEADEAEAGKRIILYAIIGLIVIGLSAVVVNFVISAFI